MKREQAEDRAIGKTSCYAFRMHAPESLVLDLLEWLAVKPRPYSEVMASWRTSCPRLPVWEDAVDFGLVERFTGEHGEALVQLTRAGETRLSAKGRSPTPTPPPAKAPRAIP